METIIYLKLLDEGTEVYRPVKALFIKPDVFEIVQHKPVDEEWEFQKGQKVICKNKLLSGENRLVAISKSTNS